MPANPQVTNEMVEIGAKAIANALDIRYSKNSTACNLYARACLTAALADHVIVPREPTYEMGEAGIASLGEDDDRQPSLLVRDIYRAMLSAAPLPQKEG